MKSFHTEPKDLDTHVLEYSRQVVLGNIATSELLKHACVKFLEEQEPALTYSIAILSGMLYSGILIQKACERFVNDYLFPKPWLSWNIRRADYIEFVALQFNVMDQKVGTRVPLQFMWWQKFFMRNIFAWEIIEPDSESDKDPEGRWAGTRRYREITLMTGRGAGKTSLMMPIIAICMQMSPNSFVALMGLNDRQARLPWEEFKRSFDFDRDFLGGNLSNSFRLTGGSGSGYATIECCTLGLSGRLETFGHGSDSIRVAGKIVAGIIADEWEAYRDTSLWYKFVSGTKEIREPLLIKLMNAPEFRSGPGWDELEKAEEMLLGKVPMDDSYFPLIYQVPEADLAKATETKISNGVKQFTMDARRTWLASIPSRGHNIADDSIGKLLKEKTESGRIEGQRAALGITPKHPEIARRWIDWESWEQCLIHSRPPESELLECELYIGMDLANTRAFNALTLAFKFPNNNLYIEFHAYTPFDTLGARGKTAKADFLQWAADGFIKTCEGKTMDYNIMIDDLALWNDRYNLRGIAMDRAMFDKFYPLLQERGLKWKFGRIHKASLMKADYREGGLIFFEHKQGLKLTENRDWELNMTRSMNRFEERYLAETPTVVIQHNPLANWMSLCTVEWRGTTTVGRRALALDKKDTGRKKSHNDLIVAMAMAVGLADWKTIKGISAEDLKKALDGLDK